MDPNLNRAHLSVLGLLLVVLTGCAVGPNYKRPAVDVPATYRGATNGSSAGAEAGSAQSLGDEKWWEVPSANGRARHRGKTA